MSQEMVFVKEAEFEEIDKLYDECINYLQVAKGTDGNESNLIDDSKKKDTDKKSEDFEEPEYETLKLVSENEITEATNEKFEGPPNINFKVENELKSNESINTTCSEVKSERLRKLSMQLPKIVITQSNTSLNVIKNSNNVSKFDINSSIGRKKPSKKCFGASINRLTSLDSTKVSDILTTALIMEPQPDPQLKVPTNKLRNPPALRNRAAYGYSYPRRIVSKGGTENIALISNVPFGKIRLLNDTFHTLINLRWRWIIMATGVIHFTMWLVFAGLWYVTALAHYDFEPVPPKRTCITGGKDFVTIFLASVEAQTTIGFGDRAIDEECPESIFLFVVQLILGTGLTGVLTCVVYAKLTRPEKLSRDGVGFSKKAVISLRDGKLCLMFRAWDFNYDHIIGSEFTAHFIYTHKTSEGEILRYFAHELRLQQRQFLLWPVTLVHEIDETSPLYRYTPEHVANNSYEITVSIKGASASLGTFTQSQSSYLPKELLWGHRFLPVVKFNSRKQKYVVDHQKLDATEAVFTPSCSASEMSSSAPSSKSEVISPGSPGSFSDQLSAFHLEKSSSFRKKDTKNR